LPALINDKAKFKTFLKLSDNNGVLETQALIHALH